MGRVALMFVVAAPYSGAPDKQTSKSLGEALVESPLQVLSLQKRLPWSLRFAVFSVLQLLKIYGFLRAGSRAGSSVILCLSSHVSLVSLSGQVFINWVLVYKPMGWGGGGGGSSA